MHLWSKEPYVLGSRGAPFCMDNNLLPNPAGLVFWPFVGFRVCATCPAPLPTVYTNILVVYMFINILNTPIYIDAFVYLYIYKFIF